MSIRSFLGPFSAPKLSIWSRAFYQFWVHFQAQISLKVWRTCDTILGQLWRACDTSYPHFIHKLSTFGVQKLALWRDGVARVASFFCLANARFGRRFSCGRGGKGGWGSGSCSCSGLCSCSVVAP